MMRRDPHPFPAEEKQIVNSEFRARPHWAFLAKVVTRMPASPKMKF